ncbi:uncharacterized protein RB166_015832 [Leptodactylus fuscus]|uniref:uncharacterized protein LOC142217654 n=1 Tax=Leptodactylus fuscus TaxID=238119 RepID=UPI003F4EF9DD
MEKVPPYTEPAPPYTEPAPPYKEQAMDCLSMRDYIRNFRLENCHHGDQGYSRVLLQLFGYTGHGKSCFINSCKYVIDDGAFRVYAKVAKSENKPETMIRTAYKLTDNITLVDNRGCVKMNKNETGAIYAQLGNFQALNTHVNWQTEFEDMVETLLNAERLDQSSDFIVPVLIYRADYQMTEKNSRSEMKEMLISARDITGLFPTVVLTHELSEHLSSTKEMFRQMGVENIFSLENYTEQDNKKTRGKHETILKCLQEIIKDIEFRMLEERDEITERIERKRILLKFAHQREMEKPRVKHQETDQETHQKKKKETCLLL